MGRGRKRVTAWQPPTPAASAAQYLITFLSTPSTSFRPPSTKSNFHRTSDKVISCAPHHLQDVVEAYKSAPH
eukprot:365990-Chlamydomonas_euryale.AAC.3